MVASRSKSWGFPRWGGYGREREPVAQQPCDWPGCTGRGDRPAPKSRLSEDRFMFCEAHAAEYNRSWNYFAGMSAEEARAAAEEDLRTARGFSQSGAWQWGTAETAEDRNRQAAYATLGLEETASEGEIKQRFRHLAKESHPDQNPGDAEAEARFKRITAAYEVLRSKAG